MKGNAVRQSGRFNCDSLLGPKFGVATKLANEIINACAIG